MANKEGLEQFMDMMEEPKMKEAPMQGKSMKIKENFGQTMMDGKHMNATKPWKPMGRK